MKKLLLQMGIVGALLTSCSNDEPMPKITENDAVTVAESSHIRSVDEAIDLVTEHYGNIIGEHTSRTALNIDRSNVIVLGAKSASRSGAVDTSLYVVNFGDDSGFAVVTADKELTPILAMTDNGEITDINDIEIPGLKAFMQASMMYAIGGGNVPKPTPTDSLTLPEEKQFFVQIADTITFNHAPEVEVAWGQKWPLGYFCPNKTAGCVVTAAVQALSHFEYPKSISLNYPQKDRSTQSLHWPYIRNNVVCSSSYPYDINNIAKLDDHLALARLCREMGYQISATYYEEGALGPYEPASTSANLENLNTYLKHITPEIEISSISYEAPNVPKMKRWNVIIMGGMRTENSTSGHAWLIDGFKSKIQHCKDYALEGKVAYDRNGNPIIPSTLEPFMEYDVTIYSMSHINWGWNGNFNGYYDVGVYNTSKCKEPDGEHMWGLDNYTYIINYFTMFKL